MQNLTDITHRPMTTWLAVGAISLFALSGCASTGSGLSSNVPMRDYECKPLSPNSNIVSITTGYFDVIGGAYVHVKRRGEAVGTYDNASTDLNHGTDGKNIYLLHPNDEKIQCRKL